MFRLSLVLMVPLAAGAQSLTPPTLGHIFDADARALRQISGVPGAASLDRVLPTDALADAVADPGSGFAVANTKDGGVLLIRLRDGAATPLAGKIGRMTLADFSRAGARVAISDGTQIEVWSLSDSPERLAEYSVEEGISALAIASEGALAAATKAGNLVKLDANGSQVLRAGLDAAALTLGNRGRDLLVTDRQGWSLVVIGNWLENPASITAASFDATPGAALTASVDGEWAALSLDEDVARVNLRTGQVQRIACNCRTSRFTPLSGNLVLAAGAFLIDFDADEPRVMRLAEEAK
jgi:hypothetical protein